LNARDKYAVSMKSRMLAGAFLAYLYNEWIGRVPSRFIRRIYLRLYLGALPQSTGVQLNCRFLNGRKVYFGENNVINFGCMFDGRKYEIRTGKNVSIGPDATILTLGHDPRSLAFEDKGGDVIIGDYVWIAYRAVILPGVKIGEGAVIAAGSVVVSDVEPWSIYGGVPARKVGERPRDLNYILDFHPFLL
jgi:acetyltransferase-like isoleucine patch superfamily enzyme